MIYVSKYIVQNATIAYIHKLLKSKLHKSFALLIIPAFPLVEPPVSEISTTNFFFFFNLNVLHCDCNSFSFAAKYSTSGRSVLKVATFSSLLDASCG